MERIAYTLGDWFGVILTKKKSCRVYQEEKLFPPPPLEVQTDRLKSVSSFSSLQSSSFTLVIRVGTTLKKFTITYH